MLKRLALVTALTIGLFIAAMPLAISPGPAGERAAMDLSPVQGAAAEQTGQLVAPWLPATQETR